MPSSLEDEGEEEKEGLILLSSLKLWWWHVGGEDDNKDDSDNNVNDDNCDDNGSIDEDDVDDACDCEEVASRQQGTTSPGGLQPSQVLIRISLNTISFRDMRTWKKVRERNHYLFIRTTLNVATIAPLSAASVLLL